MGRQYLSGQEWTLPAQLGQLKTGQDGKGLLRIHLWCPDDLPRLWDRIEIIELILISKTVLQVNARKNNGKRTSNQMPGILP